MRRATTERWTTIALTFALLGCSEEEPVQEPVPARTAEPVQEPSAPPSSSSDSWRTEVVIVGSGTPVPDPSRSGPATVVLVDGEPMLFDAGPGVVRAMVAAELEPTAVTRAFLTHLHSDHTLGLPDLVLTPWVVGRDAALEVIGPPGTEAMVDHLVAAFAEDRRVRTDGLEGKGPLRVDASDVEPGSVFESDRVRVEAFAVEHGSWEHAYGYRVDGPDRRIVISGDTGPSDAIVQACDGCDVLVHETYSTARYAGLPESARRYHGAFHTSAADVGRLATRARAKAVVLTHLLLWGATPESLVAEVREHFDGEVVAGHDGLRF